MEIFSKIMCCAQEHAVISFVNTSSEIRLSKFQRGSNNIKNSRNSNNKTQVNDAILPKNNKQIMPENIEKCHNIRASSCKPLQQKGDDGYTTPNDSFFEIDASPIIAKVNQKSEIRLCKANPFNTIHSEEVLIKSNIPYPKGFCSGNVPERSDRYSHLNQRGKSYSRHSEITTKKCDSTKCSLLNDRKSLASERTPIKKSMKSSNTNKKQKPLIIISQNDTKMAVEPSKNSTFRYVPHYFKPDLIKKFKFDADLATALAKASEHRIKGGSRHGKLSGSEITETVTSISTAAVTSRTIMERQILCSENKL